jgi:hypothetical protein
MVEGGSLGKWGGGGGKWQLQLIVVVVRKNNTFWVPWQGEVRRGKERQGEHRGKGNSVVTTGNLLGIVVRQGRCNCKEEVATAVGGEACECGLGIKVVHLAAHRHPLCPLPRPTLGTLLGVATPPPLLL